MSKSKILIIGSITGMVIAFIIFISCFLLIPRIDYAYDSRTDSYYVKKVWGNSKSYTIAESIKGKPVTKIGDRAFYQKEKLESVYFENKKNLDKIGRLSFSGCINLKEIDLTFVSEIGMNAFEECKSLESVTIGAYHILVSTFYDCSNLKNVKLINTISIGSYAFANTKIEEIDIPASTITVYNHAFDLMNELKIINAYGNQLKNNEYLLSLGICNFN